MTAYHVFDQTFRDPTTAALLTFLLDRYVLYVVVYQG
ncbi:unnamed protein product, partial [Sphacelaria rigidula]